MFAFLKNGSEFKSLLSLLKDENFVILFLGWLYIWICPFTKVEESFNLQALHDMLYHGLDLAKYDHLEFPGVVPRTFFGASIVAACLRPYHIMYSTIIFLQQKWFMQLTVRIALNNFCLIGLIRFKGAIQNHFGQDTGVFFILICCVQFHLLFYMSRPLPNTFALGFLFHAFTSWIQKKDPVVLLWLVFISVVIREDTVVLLIPILGEMVWRRELSLFNIGSIGAIAAAVSLLCTVLLDSFFWKRWVWPIGESLWFNVALNKSQEYGTSPFLWYFYSALPRLMLGTIFFVPIGLSSPSVIHWSAWNRSMTIVDRNALRYFAPILLFIVLYSFLGHKESRFIFMALPILNMIAALGMAKIYRNRQKNRYLYGMSLMCFALSALGTCGFVYISSWNYPGGNAFLQLHQSQSMYAKDSMRIHIDVPAAMTGVSRFGEIYSPHWQYSKEEKTDEIDMTSFDYVLTSTPELYLKGRTHEILHIVEGFQRIDWKHWTFVVQPHTYVLAKVHEES